MEKTSTTLERKSVKKERPSRRIINNILNYSRSLEVISSGYGRQILLINN